MAKSERGISGEIGDEVVEIVSKILPGVWYPTDVLFEGSEPPREGVLAVLRKHPDLRRWPNRDERGREFFTRASTPMTFREHFALARVRFEWFYRQDDIEALRR